MRKGIERRGKNCRENAIDHAVELMGTHGISFASQYLKNQKVTEETIARVLTDKPGARRALPRLEEDRGLWSEGENAPRQTSIRQLSYMARRN